MKEQIEEYLTTKLKPENKIACIAWLLLNVFGCKFCKVCRDKPCNIKDGETCTDNIANYIREVVKEEAGYRKQSENTVELPCKVGQTVYVPWRYGGQRGVATVIVQEIKLYDTNPSHCMFFIDMESDNECFNQSFGGWKTEQCIGKTVFLTREEAETALRK